MARRVYPKVLRQGATQYKLLLHTTHCIVYTAMC